MLEGYFDDTGTDEHSPFVGWGGFIGTTEQWRELHAGWAELLKAPQVGRPALPYFSLGECRWHSPGPFADYSATESDSLRYEVRRLLGRSGVIGRFYGVEKDAYERLVTGPAREFFREAQYLAFAECVHAAAAVGRMYFPEHEQLNLCFDQGQRSEGYREVLRLAAHHHHKTIGTPAIEYAVWGDVKHHVGLQAADTIATESFWGLKRGGMGLDPANDPHFNNFLSTVSAEGFVMGEPEIRTSLARHGY